MENYWDIFLFQIKETISRVIALSLRVLYFDEKRQFRQLLPIYELGNLWMNGMIMKMKLLKSQIN